MEDKLNWTCCICSSPADYASSKNRYCVKHWRNGDPIKPTLDNCLEATMPDWYRKVCKDVPHK